MDVRALGGSDRDSRGQRRTLTPVFVPGAVPVPLLSYSTRSVSGISSGTVPYSQIIRIIYSFKSSYSHIVMYKRPRVTVYRKSHPCTSHPHWVGRPADTSTGRSPDKGDAPVVGEGSRGEAEVYSPLRPLGTYSP